MKPALASPARRWSSFARPFSRSLSSRTRAWSPAWACRALLLAVVIVVTSAGCRRDPSPLGPPAEPARPAALTISAAISLKEAIGDVARAFEAAHPGVQLSLNLAASGDLARQVEAGAPVDVIASSDEATLDRLSARGLLAAGSRRDLAANQLVLVIRSGDRLYRADERADLRAAALARDPRVSRVCIGSPASVPAGRYAEAWLRALDVWTPLAPKLVYAGNVRQVLDYVARGEADAGIVYATDAATVPGLTVADRAPLVLPGAPPGGTATVRYPIAAVAASPRLELARAFIDAATGPAGRAALAAHGFLPP